MNKRFGAILGCRHGTKLTSVIQRFRLLSHGQREATAWTGRALPLMAATAISHTSTENSACSRE
jgi:hypothetical protein